MLSSTKKQLHRGFWIGLATATLAVALLLRSGWPPVQAAEHGSEPEKPAAAAGHGAEAAPAGGGAANPAAPTYALGPNLNGRFDINVLRRGARTLKYRINLDAIDEMIGTHGNWQVTVSVCLEFGSPSGVAEIEKHKNEARTAIQHALMSFEGAELIVPTGKYRLKETIAEKINVLMRTAQVRQVYLTDLRVIHLK